MSCHPELSPYIVDYRGPASVCNCTEQLETLQVREKETEGERRRETEGDGDRDCRDIKERDE